MNRGRDPEVTVPLVAFSDIHAAPAQRYFNLICLAYGAHPVLFAEVVDKNLLPKARARNCGREYHQVAFAFRETLRPHVVTSSWSKRSWTRPGFLL
jgi:Putative metallopeptidase